MIPEADRELIVDELGREPTRPEAVLFENLWSEHCAYRSSRRLLERFETTGQQVVVGPGDDAAVVAVPVPDASAGASVDTDTDPDQGGDGLSETYLTVGIESHNHPSYVDPYDGAATGVGGIVRDTLSMGAYPIALADSLYFGPFDREHSRYLFDGVVEGIADYGNAIGVPTVAGSVAFAAGYEENPLVNVACVGLTNEDRLLGGALETPGNALVLVGNETGRDGLGGASFASEDIEEDTDTDARPAVQVGDPYTEKLLIETNEQLLDEALVVAARDLGAAGLGGATAEMAAQGGLGARIELDAVHLREPEMSPTEILLSESQERICYEVRPTDIDRVQAVADRFGLGCSVIGEVTETGYVCRFDGDRVVDASPEFLADGAPANDLERTPPEQPSREHPDPDTVGLGDAVETVLAAPNTASAAWIYRQYDHEVGLRTALRPGDDAAVLTVDETTPTVGLALSAGANPRWTATAPYDGARGVALENATNVAAKGAQPLAVVDCLNGGNPEQPGVYGAFAAAVDGLVEMCQALGVPVVGGNVSLYNDSPSGPIPPTPTVAVLGVREGTAAPTLSLSGEDGQILLVGEPSERLGGSEYLAQFGGSDRLPALSDQPAAVIDRIAQLADDPTTRAVHDVSDGGLAVTLAEMVTPEAGASVTVDTPNRLFAETPGRVVVETTDPETAREVVGEVAPVRELGVTDSSGRLSVSVSGTDGAENETVELSAAEIATLRSTLEETLG